MFSLSHDQILTAFKRAEEQTATILALQKELEDLRASRECAIRQADEDREELQASRDRVNKLEEELSMRQSVVRLTFHRLLG